MSNFEKNELAVLYQDSRSPYQLARMVVDLREELECFVGRVEEGGIHSRTTYSKFKKALKETSLPHFQGSSVDDSSEK